MEASSNAGFTLQSIEPNKYYYYFFRTFDNYNPEIQVGPTNQGFQVGGYPPSLGQWIFPPSTKDHPYLYSNPGEVFRVRMVSYENGIFMEMDPYEMSVKKPEAKIGFERLLKISPSFDQTLINFSKSFNRLSDVVVLPENSITNLRKELELIKEKQYVADTNEFQKSAPPVDELSLGVKDRARDKIWTKKFKFRIKSKRTGKTIDLNVQYAQEKKTKPE